MANPVDGQDNDPGQSVYPDSRCFHTLPCLLTARPGLLYVAAKSMIPRGGTHTSVRAYLMAVLPVSIFILLVSGFGFGFMGSRSFSTGQKLG